MCPKSSRTCSKESNRPQGPRNAGVCAALAYEAPVYRENHCGCYIEFRAFCPETGRMRRKTIKLNRFKGAAKRRAYAREVLKRLAQQLAKGWNPWIDGDITDLVTFEEGLGRYEAHLDKMLANGYFRKETYAGYKSNIKVMRGYIAAKHPLHFMRQFDKRFCVDFLDYVFIDRNNGAQTRNNYLNFLRVLSGYFVEKGYLASKPTEGIAPISRRLFTKERECIPLDVMGRVAGYCLGHDPDFLLACYLLYYCFIRPVEMTRLRVRNFNVAASTVTIPASDSKNKRTQTVTVPRKVLQYAVGRGTLSAPAGDFIFSAKLKPGPEQIDPKIFRDHWEKVRKALKLRPEWKFYSLKDTGITEMCDNRMASIAVRDQARHSSLAITDIYTRHGAKANPDIVALDGAL